MRRLPFHDCEIEVADLDDVCHKPECTVYKDGEKLKECKSLGSATLFVEAQLGPAFWNNDE